MTKKEIKEQIAYDEERLKEVQEGYKDIKEYQELQAEIDELNEKRAKLEKRQTEIRLEYREESQEDVDFAREELKYSRELLRKAEMGLDPKDYNDELIAMFDAFYKGTTYHQFTKLQWVSDDGEYALFKVNCHSAYIGRFSGSVNSGATWALFKIEADFVYNSMSSGGIDARNPLCIWSKEGGRWGEKRDMKLVHEAIDNYENNTFMKTFMESIGFKFVQDRLDRGWINEDIVIKYTTERTHQIGPDRGKTETRHHERICTLNMGDDYYINMPKNFDELKKKYPNFVEEWEKHK